MDKSFLKDLVCPKTKNELNLVNEEYDQSGRIISGELVSGQNIYPIINYIPRFVSSSYADNFGYQWNIHNKTQLDTDKKFDISYKRFFETTKWQSDLRGYTILEAGCGMGRFTEQALKTGAKVFSFDLSNAVDANFNNNSCSNLLVVQASIYEMPFRDLYFDKVFCFGVLQHTPDVRKSFVRISQKIKKGGEIAIDIYGKHRGLNLIYHSKTRPETRTRHWIRPISKKIQKEKLYKYVVNYINFMWPICKLLNKIPYGNNICWLLCIADYSKKFDFTDEQLRDWAILDTFDMLSPEYDSPQYKETIEEWFNSFGFKSVEITYGYQGIEGRGKL